MWLCSPELSEKLIKLGSRPFKVPDKSSAAVAMFCTTGSVNNCLIDHDGEVGGGES